jgi:imidazolonepropionase-like amidohydrolase
MTNGKIAQIAQNIQNTMGATVYQLNGRWVTPGLVDTHSHLGVYSFPEDAWATQDGNELTAPVFPQLRAIDGLST